MSSYSDSISDNISNNVSSDASDQIVESSTDATARGISSDSQIDSEIKMETVDELGTEESVEESVVGEAEGYRQALQRLKADYDNFRKRTLNERSSRDEQVVGNFVDKLLPVLEAFEVGMEYDKNSLKPIYDLLLSVLTKEGLEIIQPQTGEAFNPNLHEAISHEVKDSGNGDATDTVGGKTLGAEVIEVLRVGYIWKGRLLRPAQVKATNS